MSGSINATIPIGTPANVSPDVLIADANWAWGMTGSGSYDFWQTYGASIHRDSVAMNAGTGRLLQNREGLYPVMSITGGIKYLAKGDNEGRTRGNKAAALSIDCHAQRIDSEAVTIDLTNGADVSGYVEMVLRKYLGVWQQHLPKRAIFGAMCNGVDLFGNTLTCYDGKALFATDHVISPKDPGALGPSGTGYSNFYQLAGPVDEQQFADIRDKICAVPDFDGEYLPNAQMGAPLVVVATHVQAKRWMRFVGGPNVFQNFHLTPVMAPDGTFTGASSVSLGDATIMVDPYLLQVATNKTTIVKKSFVFPNVSGQRAAFIYREQQTPIISDSGGSASWQSFEFKARELVVDARVNVALGEPRSLYLVQEP